MPAPPTRRWFQFRLRTLLVGVVLIGAACAYVAREYRIVAARKSWMARQKVLNFDGLFPVVSHPTVSKSLSPIRRLLGDLPYDLIILTNPADETSAKQLFPEAEIDRSY